MGEFQEILKTLFLFGIVTGFIPIVCVGLAIWVIQGTIQGLWNLFTVRPVRASRVARVKSEDTAVSRAERFE